MSSATGEAPRTPEAELVADKVTSRDDTEQPPCFLQRFLDAFGPVKGQEMYKQMLQWRVANQVDTILERPYPKHDILKQGICHFSLGRTRSGAWISYEMTGRMDPAKLAKQGVKLEDLIKHVAWYQEVMRLVVNEGKEMTFMSVMDLKGFSVLKAANLFFLMVTKTYTETLYKYYPGVLERIVVVNPPFGMQTIYHILIRIMPPLLQEKLVILQDVSELQQWVDPDQLPVEYSGTNTTPIWDSDSERLILEALQAANSKVAIKP